MQSKMRCLRCPKCFPRPNQQNSWGQVISSWWQHRVFLILFPSQEQLTTNYSWMRPPLSSLEHKGEGEAPPAPETKTDPGGWEEQLRADNAGQRSTTPRSLPWAYSSSSGKRAQEDVQLPWRCASLFRSPLWSHPTWICREIDHQESDCGREGEMGLQQHRTVGRLCSYLQHPRTQAPHNNVSVSDEPHVDSGPIKLYRSWKIPIT